jgi:hypothetical protein
MYRRAVLRRPSPAADFIPNALWDQYKNPVARPSALARRAFKSIARTSETSARLTPAL